jgi:hypothetical protein
MRCAVMIALVFAVACGGDTKSPQQWLDETGDWDEA